MFISRASAVRRRTRWWLLGIIAVLTIAPTVFFAHRVWADDGKSHQHAFAITSDGKRLDLGIPKEYDSLALGVNNKNEVVGMVELTNSTTHAFLSRGSMMTDLGTLGGDYSCANMINDAGQVVGDSGTASGDTHPFLWQNGKMTELGSLGGNEMRAVDLNNRGQVLVSVTYFTTTTTEPGSVGYCKYFIWQNGTYTEITGLPNKTDAYGINDKGQVALSSSEGRHFIWDQGKVTQLPSFTEDLNSFWGLTEDGRIFYQRGNYESFAFGRVYVWHSGRTTEVGGFDDKSAQVCLVNRAGQLAGLIWDDVATGKSTPFLWTNGELHRLKVDGNQAEIFAINDLGTVVGDSSNYHKY